MKIRKHRVEGSTSIHKSYQKYVSLPSPAQKREIGTSLCSSVVIGTLDFYIITFYCGTCRGKMLSLLSSLLSPLTLFLSLLTTNSGSHPPTIQMLGVMVRHHLPLSTSITIDSKTFTIDVSHGIKIIEASRDEFFTLSLKKEALSWLHNTFSTLVEVPLNHKFFIKSRLMEYDLWVEKLSNRKGHFAEIVKLGVNGGSNKTILLAGKNKFGWNDFPSLFNTPTKQSTNKQKPNFVSLSTSYKRCSPCSTKVQ